jgi:hypothetical protein
MMMNQVKSTKYRGGIGMLLGTELLHMVHFIKQLIGMKIR